MSDSETRTDTTTTAADKTADSYYSGELYMVGRRALTVYTMNPNMVEVKYQVKSPLDKLADSMQKELDEGEVRPYCRVVRAYLTDAQAMGQPPMTFIRQMLSCALYPDQISKTQCPGTYPKDVKKRVRQFLAACQGSLGTCLSAGGLDLVRGHVADMLSGRDGHLATPQDVILTRGGGGVYSALLRLIASGYEEEDEDISSNYDLSDEACDSAVSYTPAVRRGPPCVLYPVPGHPRYESLTALSGLPGAPYPLDQNYQLDLGDLERAYRAAPHTPTAIVVINPANPTGQVLSRKSLETVVNFAYTHGLIIFADEIYEDNVFFPKKHPFHSIRQVILDQPADGGCVQSIGVGSTGRGRAAEAGVRGGWATLTHFEGEIRDLLCQMVDTPSLPAQLVIHSVVKPPEEGDASYTQWALESQTLQTSLVERAHFLVHYLNCLPGVTCPPIQGGLFAFPRFFMPWLIPVPKKDSDESLEEEHSDMSDEPYYRRESTKSQLEELEGEEGAEVEPPPEPVDPVEVEAEYCRGLAAATGVLVAPGARYGLQPQLGELHFRVSFLPHLELLKDMCRRIKEYHFGYIDRFM